MESPVRIYLGAALVVYLLLLSSTPAASNASNETTSSTVRDDRSSKYAKVNGTTWVSRGKPKTPDVALNELNPKESVSEEHTDKNAKYKDRGRVRFGAQSQRTAALRSRVRGQASTSSTTEVSAPKLMIVTPEPEKKNVSQIMDSMRVYKKTKLPVIASTTPITIVKKEVTSHSEEYDNEYEEKESIEKYTTKGHSHTYHIPGFTDDDDDDFSQDSVKDATENRVHKDFSIPSYEKFSTYFPKEISYSSQHEKSESYFHNFDSDLTTPKNDIFDKRFKEISSSIIKNLDTIKTKSPRTNKTNVHKIIKENVDVSKFNQGTPTNKSTFIIKNTKEVRLSDNEGAGSANQELSDVHGTSIYYEMTVHSTETYAIDQSDDDCDNDTATVAPTPSTTNEEELSALPGTSRLVLTTLPTDSTKSSSKSSPTTTTTVSTSHNSILSTEETMTTKVFSSSYNRNRSYKRYNLNGTKEMNKITPNDQVGSNQVYRPVTRSPAKFHFTTPKTKPIWMAPRRNITRGYTKTTYPTTIYSEHFNIKDKLSTTTTRPRQPNKALTTQSSDIDPVLQSEVTGVKKVVHSQTITDNSIPSLWKRGSAKFATTTEVTTDTGDTSDLEIPPTLTAWALASLRSPPSTAVTNGTASDLKNFDENELQKVGELLENREVTTTTTTTAAATTAAATTAAATTAAATTAAATTTVASLNNDVTVKIITDLPPKRTSWKALGEAKIPETTTLMQTETTTSQIESETTENDIKTTTSLDEYEDLEATVHTTESSADETTTESKSESQPAESNISLQSSAEPHTTDNILTRRPYTDVSAADLIGLTKPSVYPPPWWTEANTSNFQDITYGDSKRNGTTPMQKIITTKSAGFESITKLPSGITTPQGDEMGLATRSHEIYPGINTALPTTTDYEITTYRSRYVPQMTTDQPIGTIDGGRITPYDWRPMLPTKTTIVQGPTKVTDIFADAPITTYRPSASSENIQETTTTIPEITSIEVELSTDTETSPPQTSQTETSVNQETTTFIETPTDTVQPTTDISIETEPPSKPTTNIPEIEPSDSITASEENSGSNEVITQISTKLTTQPSAITKELEELTSLSEPADGTTSLSPEVVKDPTTITEDVDMETTTAKLPTTLITGGKVYEDATEKDESIIESTTEPMLTTLSSELESSSGILSPEEAGSGAAIAITVSTIGVIALILLVGLLLVVRRRGRRGVYAQRCTPVSLDAYSLDSVSVGHRKGGNHLRASKRSYGNPAFDDEVTSHPMQYAALANFALDTEQMTTEFSEIPSVTVRPDEVPPGCEDKNRYSNVLPLPETRVPLQRIGNDPTTEYINANYVTGPGNIKNYYIACQAPLHNTVADLWRMIWEQNSRLIVMLTEYMENGVEKCYEYLPPSEISDNRRTFGDFQVILKKREQHDKYAISTVQLINLRTRTWREITHMWYFWPAKGVPDDYDSIIDFLTEMRGYMKMSQAAKEYDEDGVEVIYGESRSSFHNLSKLRSDENASNGNGVHVYSPAKAEELLRRNTVTNGTLSRMKVASEIEGVRPCVVMCASGAGRAAAVIALDVCARALSGGSVDVPRVVRELRAQRPHSLANRHHYIFVYKVLSEYGNKLMGGGVDTI